MDLITLDMETYYDKDYSLSKMTTEEYIRDPRFQVIGVSTKVNDGPTTWVTGTAKEVLTHLHSLPWSSSMLLAQNTMFDGAILTWRCGIRPKALADTMLMSRALRGTEVPHSLKSLAEHYGLGAKGDEVLRAIGKRRQDFTAEEMARYGEYCRNDVDLTKAIFDRMMADGFPLTELKLIDITLRMFTDPMLELDRAHLEAHLTRVRQRKQDLLDAAGVADRKDLMSNNKFADMLRSYGVEPPTKISPTTGKETYAFAKTDEAFKALQESDVPAVAALVSTRLGVKSTLEESRTERFIGIASRGKLPVPIRYYAAHCLTGDAEVLTPTGWAQLSEWQGGEIMQWAPDGAMQFLPATANRFVVNEPVVTYASRYHNATYTLGHTIPTFSGRGVFTPRKAGEARTLRFELPLSGISDGNASISVLDAQVAVMVQADGSVRTGRSGRSVRFGFKKDRKISRCVELLGALGVPFTSTVDPAGATRIVVPAAGFDRVTKCLAGAEKRFRCDLMRAPVATKQAFMQELSFWDGSAERSGGGFQYTTTSKHNAEFVQTMAHLCGRAAYVSVRDRRAQGWSLSYRVQVRNASRTRVHREHASMSTHVGEVFCPTTDTGYFLFRQNGHIAITGNTGRWGGADKINLQNLPSRGENGKQIKKGIIAPSGHVLIDADSAQIEARVLAWLAEQEDVVQTFAEGGDVYKMMASKIFAKEVADVDPGERQVGKVVILGAGYGVGHLKLQTFLKLQAGVEVSESEAKRIIDIYRGSNYKISGLWKQAQVMLKNMVQGQSVHIGRPGVLTTDASQLGIKLPSGMYIRYTDLKGTPGEYGLEYSYKVRRGRNYIYGGKCLAGDTEVLTDRGWVHLRDVTRAHRVWDGTRWVNHDGLIYQGKKRTAVVNGVRMTPDHNVLTEKGWRCASSSEGLHRAGFWLPDGTKVSGDKWPTLCVGLPVQLRDGSFSGGYRHGKICPTWRAPLVRVQSWGREQIARVVEASGVLGVEVNAGSVPVAYASSVAQLRGTGYQGVSGVGAFIRGVLGGHGADVSGRADAGSEGQQRRLYSGELPVGDTSSPSRKPAQLAPSGHSQGPLDDGYFTVDPALSLEPEPVYDLLNAGPNTRFVVRGSSGPFIVHNCVENVVQALARCIVGEQMVRIAKRYRPVLTVHDSVVCCVRDSEAEEAQAYIEECMRWKPDWAEGLPVDCESEIGRRYGE